jgi:quercetin dioxygenase-like cupin family protein
MKLPGIKLGVTALLCVLSLPTQTDAAPENKPIAAATAFDSHHARVSLVYEHDLPQVPGKAVKGVLVEYEPGGFTPSHTHPKSAFIYATVLEGAITSQVNDSPVKTYKAGQNFSEMPGDKHGVSKNASDTKPAKLLAVFIVDKSEKELTTLCK